MRAKTKERHASCRCNLARGRLSKLPREPSPASPARTTVAMSGPDDRARARGFTGRTRVRVGRCLRGRALRAGWVSNRRCAMRLTCALVADGALQWARVLGLENVRPTLRGKGPRLRNRPWHIGATFTPRANAGATCVGCGVATRGRGAPACLRAASRLSRATGLGWADFGRSRTSCRPPLLPSQAPHR